MKEEGHGGMGHSASIWFRGVEVHPLDWDCAAAWVWVRGVLVGVGGHGGSPECVCAGHVFDVGGDGDFGAAADFC